MQTDRLQHPQLKDVPRTKEQALNHIAKINNEKTEASKQELRKKYGLHERRNPLFDLPVDLYRYA